MIRAIIAALLLLFITLKVTFQEEPKACSDYLLIGRTFDKCITDKRTNED